MERKEEVEEIAKTMSHSEKFTKKDKINTVRTREQLENTMKLREKHMRDPQWHQEVVVGFFLFLFFLSSRTVYSFLFHFIFRPHSFCKMSALWMDEAFVFCGGDAVS